MKFKQTIFLLTSLIMVLVFHSPVFSQTTDTIKKVSAREFANLLKAIPSGVIIDARTSQEFEKGHLKYAANYNVLAADEFDRQIATIDKATPVFVYCQSGKRSTAAAGKLRSEGFSQIYELTGGINEWRESNYEEMTGMPIQMTRNQFENMLDSGNTVLVEFYNSSCQVCKKLESNLNAVKKKKGEKMTIIQINTDENPNLVKELFVGEIPALHLYKKRKLTWATTGIASKREILKQLK